MPTNNTVEIILKGTDLTGPAFTSSIRRMQQVGKAAGDMFAVFATGAAVGAVGSLVALTAKSIEAADEMGKLAQKAGLPVEQFSQLAFAAKQADVSNEALIKGIKTLSEEMVKLGRGGEPVLDQLLAQADVFSKMENGADKTARAVALFGKSGQDLIPLLNRGSMALREEMREADRLGQTISSKFASDANDFNDNLTKIKGALMGVGNEIAKTVLPDLKRFSEWILQSQAIPIFFETIKGSIDDVTEGIKALIRAASTLPEGLTAGQSGKPKWFPTQGQIQGGTGPGGTNAFGYTTEMLAALQNAVNPIFLGPPDITPAKVSGGIATSIAGLFAPSRTVGTGSSPINPGMAGINANTMDQWASVHANTLEKAKELEQQFLESRLQGSELEKARIDGDYQYALEKIQQLGIDEEYQLELSEQAQVAYHERLRQLQAQTFATNADIAARGFGALASLAGAFGKKWFALQQAMRLGEAIMHGAAGIARAFADWPYPYSAVVAGIVGVETAAQIAMIAAQKPPQAHSGAEYIPETATYLLQRGERVLATDQNAQLMAMLNGWNNQQINLHLDGQVVASYVWNGSRDGRVAVHPRAVRESM